MGIILNVRGTSGSGKSEFARRMLLGHLSRPGSQLECATVVRAGRDRPMGYLLQTGPLARARPLVIVGHYERTSGGCDTILKSHGGMEEVFAIADRYSGRDLNVFLEGNELSREYRRSLDLARRHPLYIFRLITPVEECVRRLAKRRGLRRQHLARLYEQLEDEARSIQQACETLASLARVEQLDFDQGMARAEELLGIRWITAMRNISPSI